MDGFDTYNVLSAADKRLAALQEEELEFLKVLRPAIEALRGHIGDALRVSDHGNSTLRVDGGGDLEGNLAKSLRKFEELFENVTPAEFTYLVQQVRGFSTPTLVQGADETLSAVTLGKIGDEARKDIVEAGRCLAFEVPTAAGVHIMRGWEKVFRKYYKAVTGREAGIRDIHKLLEDLKKLPNADTKTLGVIDQIRDLHRNPLAHEVFLDTDEAVDLFYIANSAITAMARAL
jgi:hypothetical protein